MWQLLIKDPSGETRVQTLDDPLFGDQGIITLGREESCQILLRDSRTAPLAAQILKKSDYTGATMRDNKSFTPFWIRVLDRESPLRLGDLWVQEAQLPLGLTVKLGET